MMLSGWHSLRASCAPGVTGSSEVLGGVFFVPIVQMRKRRLREAKLPA